MELFVLILNKTEYLQDVLTYYVEVGVSGATVLESTGMGRIMAEDIPIFAGFRDLLRGNRPSNRMILAVMPEGMGARITSGLEKIIGPLDEPGVGIAFSIPLSWHAGIRE